MAKAAKTATKAQASDRTTTGVPGLDEILYGGIPRQNLVVISGDPGSGKTCLCLEFLYRGALEYNEPGIYVSLEESEEEVVRIAAGFGWDFQTLINEKKVILSKVLKQ